MPLKSALDDHISYRSPLCNAREAWFESEEGRMCAAGQDPCLRYRLELAFIAGAQAQLKVSEALVRQLEDFIARRSPTQEMIKESYRCLRELKQSTTNPKGPRS